MSPDIVPPTEQEIDLALEIISRAARARKADGTTDRELFAFREQKKKNRALAAKCDELQDPIYRRLADALPEDLKKLLDFYGLMVLAPYAVNSKSFGIFRASHRKAKRLLALQS